MDFRIGILMAPVMIFGMMLRDRGPGHPFLKAGATDPEHARRPASLGVTSDRAIHQAVRTGVLVAMGDGRYWVHAKRYRRRRLAAWTVVITVGLVTGGIVGWMGWRQLG